MLRMNLYYRISKTRTVSHAYFVIFEMSKRIFKFQNDRSNCLRRIFEFKIKQKRKSATNNQIANDLRFLRINKFYRILHDTKKKNSQNVLNIFFDNFQTLRLLKKTNILFINDVMTIEFESSNFQTKTISLWTIVE